MARYRQIDQTNLILQVDLTNQLMPGTFEHAMAHIVDTKIDTSIFDEHFNNDETGAPAYDPKSLLKVILFAYSKGILSSRKIETACRENIIFMALSGDQRPDHSTIAAFVSEQCRPINRIFTQVLMLCAQMDLIGMEYLAIDGCKISSNAAKEHSGTHKEMKKKKVKLRAKVDHLLSSHTANDSGTDDGVTKAVKHLERDIARIEKFLGTHEPRSGSSPRSGEVKSNITDNQSAKLKSSSGFIQGYNGLAAVDSKHQVILGTLAVGQQNEADLLPEILDELPGLLEAASLGKESLQDVTLLADTGYHSAENLEELAERGIDAVIPDNKFRSRDVRFATKLDKRRQDSGKVVPEDFVYDKENDTYLCPKGAVLTFWKNQKNGRYHRSYYRAEEGRCTGCPRATECFRRDPKDHRVFTVVTGSSGHDAIGRMRARIDSPEGRRTYSKRMGIVEPVFGNIKATKSMNYFTMRGEKKVNIQWMLYALVHNIEKLLTTGAVTQMGIG